MTESTLDMLTKQVEYAAETIAEYARQIKSGEYEGMWSVELISDEAPEDEEPTIYTYRAVSEDDAYRAYRENHPFYVPRENTDINVVESADEPTVDETPISEYPLSVEVKIGRPLAVVIGTGGPHIEIVQDLSDGSAKLAGYWGGEKVFRYGDDYQTVLDYFTDSLWDEAPEEYK